MVKQLLQRERFATFVGGMGHDLMETYGKYTDPNYRTQRVPMKDL